MAGEKSKASASKATQSNSLSNYFGKPSQSKVSRKAQEAVSHHLPAFAVHIGFTGKLHQSRSVDLLSKF
jgi:hypothetical protein